MLRASAWVNRYPYLEQNRLIFAAASPIFRRVCRSRHHRAAIRPGSDGRRDGA